MDAAAVLDVNGARPPAGADLGELFVTPTASSDAAPATPGFWVTDYSDGATRVPPFWARSRFRTTDVRPAPEPMHPRCVFVGELRADQRAALAVIDETRAASGGGCVLSLPTGAGKTVVALASAVASGHKTIVVVHKRFLARQWRERVGTFVPGARVTAIEGASFDDSGDVVIAMLQTLCSRKYPAAAFRRFGTLIVDEAHHVAARGFSRAMFALCVPLTLGLSATPDRKDGLLRVIEWFLGPVAHVRDAAPAADVTVRVHRYSPAAGYPRPWPPENRRGDVCFGSMLTALAADDGRTSVLADVVAELAVDRDVLVLAHRRSHCTALRTAVAARTSAGCDTYLGGDKTPPTSRVVVSTYALTGEGFDAPRFTALVLASPVSDVTQAVGRVMRGTAPAVVVDLVDAFGIGFAQAAKRRKQYRAARFSILNA